MTAASFTKMYRGPEQAEAAARHHRWLTTHAQPMRQPALLEIRSSTLSFERIDGRHVRPGDLVKLAGLMGDAHGSAWASDLHRATLDMPHTFSDGTSFPDFLSVREAALRRRLEQGHLPDKPALHTMLSLLEQTANGSCAFYKDSNPRNFLITGDGTCFAVDTDDLTLAPPGYDLAKLITTLLMSYGPLAPSAITEALTAYNRAAGRHDPLLATTSRERLDDFLTLHSVLTAPYAGRHGYHYASPSRNEGS
jgi:hypothetical protein